MNFQTVKASIVNILGIAAVAGGYQVIGFQRQGKAAIEVEDDSRFVQVFYSSGQFTSGRRVTGPVQHDATFKIEFTVAKAATCDLSVLSDPASSALEKSSALGAMIEASSLADASLDAVFQSVYQTIMDGRNYELGMTKGDVANRWIGDFQKDEPAPNGELVVLTGSCNLTLRCIEEVPGETGTVNEGIGVDFKVKDDTAKAEVEIPEV